jgi:hypothetical protein
MYEYLCIVYTSAYTIRYLLIILKIVVVFSRIINIHKDIITDQTLFQFQCVGEKGRSYLV